jgi:RsiW-degrading membrane proteinase PrsW (M82 family)/GNAT superfamily N-acetyltransferase
MLLTALAIAPGLAICFFFFYKDAHNPEPARYLLVSFLLGMVAVLPAALIELRLFRSTPHSVPETLFTAYFVVGLVEEGCKFAMLRAYGFTRPSFDEPLDGIVYAVMVSMGFATLENVGYIWRHGYEVAILRMFTSVPAHASFAVVMGYFAGKAKFDPARRSLLLLCGLLGAAFLHGTYDAFLLLSENHWLTQYISEVLLVSGALVSLFLAVHLSRKMLRQYYRTSERLFSMAPVWEVQQVTLGQLPQVHLLVTHALMEEAQGGNPGDQALLRQWATTGLMRKAWFGGHRFMLVFNAGLPVGFIAFNAGDLGQFHLLHLFVLVHHRARGTGRFLLRQAEKEMVAAGATAIILSLKEQDGVRLFFEKSGFETNGAGEVTSTQSPVLWLHKNVAVTAAPGNASLPFLYG